MAQKPQEPVADGRSSCVKAESEVHMAYVAVILWSIKQDRGGIVFFSYDIGISYSSYSHNLPPLSPVPRPFGDHISL